MPGVHISRTEAGSSRLRTVTNDCNAAIGRLSVIAQTRCAPGVGDGRVLTCMLLHIWRDLLELELREALCKL